KPRSRLRIQSELDPACFPRVFDVEQLVECFEHRLQRLVTERGHYGHVRERGGILDLHVVPPLELGNDPGERLPVKREAPIRPGDPARYVHALQDFEPPIGDPGGLTSAEQQLARLARRRTHGYLALHDDDFGMPRLLPIRLHEERRAEDLGLRTVGAHQERTPGVASTIMVPSGRRSVARCARFVVYSWTARPARGSRSPSVPCRLIHQKAAGRMPSASTAASRRNATDGRGDGARPPWRAPTLRPTPALAATRSSASSARAGYR